MRLQHRPASPRGRHATSYGQNYPRVVGWTLLGGLIPGAGLLAAGRRISGWLVLGLAALLVAGGAAYMLLEHPTALAVMFLPHPDRLLILAGVLLVLLVLWALMVLGTYTSLRRFSHLGTGQRTVSSLIVLAMIALVALPTVRLGNYALITRSTIYGIVSKNGNPSTTKLQAKGDPWAKLPRVNVLLIGSDAGADRTGIRPDTLILASINTKTGDMVLFSLPRNLQRVPFPAGTPQAAEYPNGFQCVDAAGVPQCLLNAFWTFGEEHWKTYYSDQPTEFDAGLTATSQAVEQVTGLHVDQYAMLNLRGFMQFVDAIGGVTINVKERLPIGGNTENPSGTTGWIEPGVQHLDGYKALWYARSRRTTDDYDRMRRQRCVIGAVIHQSDPAKLALAFPQIASAAKNNIITGIPLADLSAWVTLAEKVQKAHVRSLPFTASVVDTEHPDFAEIHQLVTDAIDSSSTTVTASPTPSASPSPSASTKHHTTSSSPSVNPSEARTAQDVTAVC